MSPVPQGTPTIEGHGRTIFRVTYGSHLFGTATPASDLDIKSVFVPRPRDILLGRVRGSVSTKREKTVGERNHAGEVEEEAYSLQRFLGLAAEGQTVAIDLLFAPRSAWLGEPAPEWAGIIANRHRLLTRKSKAFIGYCIQQATRYGAKGSRVAAARAALELLDAAETRLGSRAKLATLDAAVRDLVAVTEHAALVDLPQPGGGRGLHLEVCGRKLPYTVAIKDAAGIMRRVVADYGVRAVQAESQQGVDWKALSHAVRVATQGLTLLETGRIAFPAANVERVRAIKRGDVPHGDVMDEIEALLSRVQSAAERSTLPDEADRGWIDDFVAATYAREIRDAAPV